MAIALEPRIIKRHDTAQQAQARLETDAGTPVALTGATVVYTLTNVATGEVKVLRAPGVVRNQLSFPGEVYYQWVAGDVDTAGTYAEEWEVTYPGGAKETFPVGQVQYVVIEPDADNV